MDLFGEKVLNVLGNLEINGEIKRVPQPDGDDKWYLTEKGNEVSLCQDITTGEDIKRQKI